MDSARHLRDLIWAVRSQSLLAPGPHVAISEYALDPTQVDQQHLSAFLAETSGHRVGRYFERLMLYWLQHVRGLEIVAESQQIVDQGRTIGEIDLLFVDEQSRLTHWEIAVKFYLHSLDSKRLGSHLVGPNSVDTFERKTERLFSHQLPLSKTHYPDVEVRQAFVKGAIFYHPLQKIGTKDSDQLSTKHSRGSWIRNTELDLIAPGKGFRYRIMRKPFWLSPERSIANDSELQMHEALLNNLEQHFCECESPVLICQLARDGEEYSEVDRFFVVSKTWPEPPVSRTGRRAHAP